MLGQGPRSAHGALASTFLDFSSVANIHRQDRDILKSRGWQVIERDGVTKPNRFGYAPDG
jgi:hypothetical protein